MGRRLTFIEKLNRRAKRQEKRAAEAELMQTAHIDQWHDIRTEQERETVRTSVAVQRRNTGATGVPESITPLPYKRIDREVANPMLTDGLAYSGQRNAHMRVTVEENAMTRIGALVFIRKREDYHERAAEEFKSLYEARYGGQGGAMDPGRVQVDTSPIAHDSGMAAKIDRTVKLEMAIKAMDKPALNRLIACLILGVSCEDQVPTLPSGRANQRQSGKCVEETLAALDHLATMWGYRTRAA